MTYRIGDLRNLEANMYYTIASGLTNNYGYTILESFNESPIISGIYLVHAYPENLGDIKLPAIAVDFENKGTGPFQLGSGKVSNYRFSIDIFGRNKGQKSDLSEKVENMFSNTSMTLYDYNDVFESSTYTLLGLASFTETFMFPVRDFSYETTKYMNRIVCTATLYINSGTSLV